MSVSTKIAIQLNCKLGGEVWALDIPVSILYLWILYTGKITLFFYFRPFLLLPEGMFKTGLLNMFKGLWYKIGERVNSRLGKSV